MTKILQHNQIIVTQAAANEAQRRIQDWIAAHAGPDTAKVKKSITTQGNSTVYEQGNLLIETAATGQNPFARRCNVYSVQFHPQTGITRYSAHALVIFPHEVLGSGVISVTVHQPDDWRNENPPWKELWTDPSIAITEIAKRISDHDHRLHDRRRTKGNDASLQNLQEARQTRGPMVILTPKGDQDKAFSTLIQQHRTSANIIAITEADQLKMSSEIPDDFLRQWLNAKALLIKDTYDPVPNDHPITAFDHPDSLRPILESMQEDQTQIVQTTAQRSIIRTFLDILNDYQTLQDVMEEARKRNPENLQNAAFTVMNNETLDQPETADTPPAKSQQELDLEAQASRSHQRISTLEDQLKQEQDINRKTENQLRELQAQLQAYQQHFEETASHPGTPTAPEDGQSVQSREDLVMEAVTQPGRFPHLRFLNTISKSLSDYDKPYPKGQEIVSALDTIDSLAELYLTSDRGNVGSWKEHLNLPGWTYANSESENTMGKYPKSRTFQDHEKNRQLMVQRHLTCRVSNSGLQIFFDADEEGGPFIIAYIGEHLPHFSNS